MKKTLITSALVAAVGFATLGMSGTATAYPYPQPGDKQSDGDAAVMTMMHALGECMYGVTPGVPRAISNDRGVMIFCMR